MKPLFYLLGIGVLVMALFTLREGVFGFKLALGEVSARMSCDATAAVTRTCSCYGIEKEIPNPNQTFMCEKLLGCYGVRNCGGM